MKSTRKKKRRPTFTHFYFGSFFIHWDSFMYCILSKSICLFGIYEQVHKSTFHLRMISQLYVFFSSFHWWIASTCWALFWNLLLGCVTKSFSCHNFSEYCSIYITIEYINSQFLLLHRSCKLCHFSQESFRK